jgi:hypothetical protein
VSDAIALQTFCREDRVDSNEVIGELQLFFHDPVQRYYYRPVSHCLETGITVSDRVLGVHQVRLYFVHEATQRSTLGRVECEVVQPGGLLYEVDNCSAPLNRLRWRIPDEARYVQF